MHLDKVTANLTVVLFEVEPADYTLNLPHPGTPKVFRSSPKTRIALSSHVATNVLLALEELFRRVYILPRDTTIRAKVKPPYPWEPDINRDVNSLYDAPPDCKASVEAATTGGWNVLPVGIVSVRPPTRKEFHLVFKFALCLVGKRAAPRDL
jgi:hypothetical protein